MKWQVKIILLALSIILFILPGFKLTFAIWFCFVPILYLISRVKFEQALLYSLIFALATSFNIYWINYYETGIWLGVATSWVILLVVFLLLSRMAFEKFQASAIHILTPPVIFTAFQYINFDSLRPFWLNIGVFQPNFAPLIWYTGALGVTFTIVLFNALFVSFLLQKKRWKLISLALLALLIVACLSYSSLKKYDSPDKIKVGAVQLKIRKSWQWRTARTELLLAQYRDLTLKLKNFQPDLVLWPEYALPTDVYNSEQLKKETGQLSASLNTTLVLGSLEWGRGEYHTDNVLVFDQGRFLAKYDSIAAFPLNPVIEGQQKPLFETRAGKFTANLCYEEVTPEAARKNIARANYLLFMANNQDVRTERGRYLTSLYSRARSAENRRFGIRSANYGFSQLISPTGKVIAKTQEQVLKGKIPLIKIRPSFYSKYGNLIMNLIILLYSGLLLYKLRRELI